MRKLKLKKEKGKSPFFAHLYLVESNSIGGFSGSPVFFEVDRITPTKIFHTPEIYLGGIMKGHYNDILKIKLAYTGK